MTRTTHCPTCGSDFIHLSDLPRVGWMWICNERLCGAATEPAQDDRTEIEAKRRPWLKEIPDPVVNPVHGGTERFAALGEV